MKFAFICLLKKGFQTEINDLAFCESLIMKMYLAFIFVCSDIESDRDINFPTSPIKGHF